MMFLIYSFFFGDNWNGVWFSGILAGIVFFSLHGNSDEKPCNLQLKALWIVA